MPHNPTVSEEVLGVIQNTFICPFALIDSSQDASNSTSTGNDGKNTIFVYMGTAGIPAQNARLRFLLNGTVLGGSVQLLSNSWAQMGVFRGTFSLMGTASLTKLGVVDIEPLLFNSNAPQSGAGANPGEVKSITVPLDPPIRPGDDIWYGYGISASSMPNFVALTNNGGSNHNAMTGIVQQMVPPVKPSTLTGPFTTAGMTSTATSRRPICVVMNIY